MEAAEALGPEFAFKPVGTGRFKVDEYDYGTNTYVFDTGDEPFPVPPPVLKGDVNGDLAVDIIDALMVAQYYVGLIAELLCT